MAKRPSIGDRVKELRHPNGLTQLELCELADIPYPTLTSLEYNKVKDPQVSTVIKLAKAFKLSLDEFIFGKKR